MALVNGKELTREELLKRVGNVSQLAGVRPFEFRDGKADGIKAFDISNGGGIDLTVLQSKCLDLFNVKYRGINLNFTSKPGLVSPPLSDLYGMGMNFLRSVSGGLLYTCGLSNVGAACHDEGQDHCFHGRIRNIPAEKVSVISRWEDDDYILGVSGQMREAALFNDNLVLHRTIKTSLGSKSFTISDRVENEGYEDQALMIMYHINIGYPLLNEGAELLLPRRDTMPRDDESEKGIKQHDQLTAPVDHFKEQVFYHNVASEPDGSTAAGVINEKLGFGLYIKYNKHQLSNLTHWKSMMSGDYVLGIEPANCLCNGRLDEKQRDTLKRIAPFEAYSFDLEIGILEGENDYKEFRDYIQSL